MDRAGLADRLEQNLQTFLAHAERAERDPDQSYRHGGWTVRQVLAHLAEVEFINLWRFGRATAEPGSRVEPFSENEWARRLDYDKRPIALSRDLFAAARRTLHHLVRTLPDDALRASCEHPEKGMMSGYDWAKLNCDHTDHHLSQVAAALEQTPWTAPRILDAWKFGVRTPLT